MNTKASILTNIAGRVNIKTAVVQISAWGGDVIVRGLTAAERDDFELSNIAKDKAGKTESDLRNVRAKLVARCVVDEAGNRVFEDADADALAGEAATIIDPLFSKAQSLSGMSTADVEELAKN